MSFYGAYILSGTSLEAHKFLAFSCVIIEAKICFLYLFFFQGLLYVYYELHYLNSITARVFLQALITFERNDLKICREILGKITSEKQNLIR